MADELDARGERPPLTSVADTAVAAALGAGLIIAVPAVGSYCLAMRAGPAETEARSGGAGGRPRGSPLCRRVRRGPAFADLGLDGRARAAARSLLARPGRGVRAARLLGRRDHQRGARRGVGGRSIGGLGRRGGHARRPRAAQAVPGAWALAHGAAQFHRSQGSGQGLRRGRRGARRGRRTPRRAAPTLVDATVSPIHPTPTAANMAAREFATPSISQSAPRTYAPPSASHPYS